MILHPLQENSKIGKKSLYLLLDPDKLQQPITLKSVIDAGIRAQVDCFMVGGSLLVSNNLNHCIKEIQAQCNIPVLLFPGSSLHIDAQADGILFLSLISGRNPDLLIGQHVNAAPILKRSGLEVIPTGYMLVGDDASTTVAYISQTTPIPSQKTDIAVSTAIAGEMLGLKLIYIDAGSGAKQAILPTMIEQIKSNISVPLVVGGGINTLDKAQKAYHAGADAIVVGTGVEENIAFAEEVAALRDAINS